MIFQIHKHIGLVGLAPDRFSWTLEKQDEPLARSARDDFESEAAVRSDIAAVRKSLKGAAFAKVKSPEGRTS